MKKKLLTLCTLLLLIIMIIFVVNNQKKDYHSSIAVMCSAKEYVEIDNKGYLTLVLDDNKATQKTLQVKDEKLKEELSSSDIKNIIGAHIFLNIPYKVIKEKHIYIESLNSADLMLSTSEFDTYYEIVDVSYK